MNMHYTGINLFVSDRLFLSNFFLANGRKVQMIQIYTSN